MRKPPLNVVRGRAWILMSRAEGKTITQASEDVYNFLNLRNLLEKWKYQVMYRIHIFIGK